MSSLLRSIQKRWKDNATLCALIRYSKVYTGRIPQTELYKFPYVSVLAVGGSQTKRTDKTRYSHGIISFHIWVDDARLEFAEKVADEIALAYADHYWSLSPYAKVIDCLDGGEPIAHQADMPNVKAWEVVKMFTFCLMRDRASTEPGTCSSSSSGGSSSSTGSSE